MRPLMLFLGFIFLVSCDKVKSIFQEEDLLERPVAKRCSECHQNIYDQWKNSRHALSWTSHEFKRATENYSKEKCLSCHAPYEVSVNDKPMLREKDLSDGVNCVSCHFKDLTKSMHGPYEVFSPPHPSTQDSLYTKSEICSGCHQETYKQYKSVAVEKSCQSCHMPSQKGKLIQKFPFEFFHTSKEIHHHGFLVPDSKPDFFRVEVLKNKDSISVFITNLKVPHNVPTADHGNPKYYVDIQLIKNNQVVYSDGQTISKKEAFIPKQTKELSFPVNIEYEKVVVKLSRKLSWEEKPKKIAEFKF